MPAYLSIPEGLTKAVPYETMTLSAPVTADDEVLQGKYSTWTTEATGAYGEVSYIWTFTNGSNVASTITTTPSVKYAAMEPSTLTVSVTAEDALGEGWTYCAYQMLRTVRPMEVAFAAITGAQLDRWYKSRAYCGRCGAKMKPSEIERAMVCPDCGMIEYPKICPAVIVAVRDGEKLLLTRYADRPYRGPALIAGFVEVGETLEDTVRREVLEEVGLHVKNIRYYKNQPWSFTDTLLVGFYCDLDGEAEIHLDRNELCEGVWMERSELPVRENDVSLTAEMIELFRLGRDKGEPR